MGTVVAHYFEGDFPAFQVPPYQLVSSLELVFYTIKGFLCGFTSYLFIKVLFDFETFTDKHLKIPGYLKPALGGAAVGTSAIFFPDFKPVTLEDDSQAALDHMIDAKVSAYLLWKTCIQKNYRNGLAKGNCR